MCICIYTLEENLAENTNVFLYLSLLLGICFYLDITGKYVNMYDDSQTDTENSKNSACRHLLRLSLSCMHDISYILVCMQCVHTYIYTQSLALRPLCFCLSSLFFRFLFRPRTRVYGLRHRAPAYNFFFFVFCSLSR